MLSASRRVAGLRERRAKRWTHPEESLITNARQPPLIDGNFSCISPSVAFGHEELDRQSEQPLSDSLLSFMKHERSILQASLDEGAVPSQ
ncbi:hypothetical protein MRX96_051881 [Rhipicephalus microplus]